MRSGSKRVAWLCLILTLWSAYAFATHHHSSSIEPGNCTVCIAAHSASPIIVSNLPHAVLVLVATVVPKTLSAKQSTVTFALTVRPPPAV
jgi:hypothetical protein